MLVGTAKGELHFLTGWEGKEKKGFPVQMDSVAAQVKSPMVTVPQ